MGNSEEGVETRTRGKLQTRARAGAQSARRDATSSVDGTDRRLLPSASTPLPPRWRHGQPLASIPTTVAVLEDDVVSCLRMMWFGPTARAHCARVDRRPLPRLQRDDVRLRPGRQRQDVHGGLGGAGRVGAAPPGHHPVRDQRDLRPSSHLLYHFLQSTVSFS